MASTKKSRSAPRGRLPPPRESVCRTCGAKVVTAVHDGIDIKLEGTPLSLEGEAITLLAGLRVYHWCDSFLHRRRAGTIRLEPRPLTGTIHRPHVCGVLVEGEQALVRVHCWDRDEPDF